ncbi:MAG: hypothetical protein Udaeo2_09970 [Candidatus Udaeobacter sp.]|nr:MAG: hypothetical protein Udaeo2_09970 [Candidatus Udaeobacter sp.]
MLVRQIDFALSAEGIVFACHRQLFDLQVGRFQIQFRAQVVDGGLEECERCAFYHEMAAKFSITGVHRSINRDFPRKVAGVRAKQRREIAQLIDRCRNVAAKIRTEPAGCARGKRSFTA